MRLLTAVSLVRVQQGEPKAKHRFTRCFVFVFREDVGQRRCGAAVSRLLTGSEPSAACGRYSEAENGQGQRALQASARAMRPCPNLRSLVRVQQGEPKAKHRFTRCFVFVFREDVGQRRCGAAVSRLLTGSEPSAACGRYSEAENGQGQRALQALAHDVRSTSQQRLERGWYFVWILPMRKSCILRAAYLALGLIYRLIGFRFMCYALFAETKGTSLQTISAHRLHHSIPGSRFHDE